MTLHLGPKYLRQSRLEINISTLEIFPWANKTNLSLVLCEVFPEPCVFIDPVAVQMDAEFTLCCRIVLQKISFLFFKEVSLSAVTCVEIECLSFCVHT